MRKPYPTDLSDAGVYESLDEAKNVLYEISKKVATEWTLK